MPAAFSGGQGGWWENCFHCPHGHPLREHRSFRRENKALFTESFVKVLALAQELKLGRFGQSMVSVDGTKVEANASKHAAVSYQRAGETIAQLELEVQQLIAKAEQADATPLAEGLTIPAEIERREKR